MIYSAKEIYEMPFEDILYNPRILFGIYYNHMGEDIEHKHGDEYQNSERLEIRVIKRFDFDHRRFWLLATVWMDKKPVMIIQNAGREGDDHNARFITDEPLYKEMIFHIRELFLPRCRDIHYVETINSELKIPILTAFYGNSLDGYFDRY